MILENRCHGIRPLNRFTVRVQSEMLSSNSRSGASFFIDDFQVALSWELIGRADCLVGRKRTRGPENDTLCMVFDQDAIIFFLLSFCFFSLWSRKLHLRYAHRYFLDIYDTLEQSKELSRRGFWLDDTCLKMTIGFTLLLYSFTFAEEVLGASSSAKDPELTSTWIFASAIPGRKLKRW